MAEEYRIVIETEESGNGVQPSTQDKDGKSSSGLSIAKSIANNVPYGDNVASAVGSIQSASSAIGTVSKLSSGLTLASVAGVATLALSTANKAYDYIYSQVQDARNSTELQRRAGLYRR